MFSARAKHFRWCTPSLAEPTENAAERTPSSTRITQAARYLRALLPVRVCVCRGTQNGGCLESLYTLFAAVSCLSTLSLCFIHLLLSFFILFICCGCCCFACLLAALRIRWRALLKLIEVIQIVRDARVHVNTRVTLSGL